MMIRYWFPTLIYNDILTNFDSNFNHNLYESVKEIQKNNKRKVSWNCGTYSTLNLDSIDLSKEKYFSELLEICYQHVQNYASEFNIIPGLTLKCKDIWANIASPGDFQERHNHPNSIFSLVYYVKCPKNCGDIVFYSPNSEENLLIPTQESNEANFKYCYYEPIESSVLVFRSSLPHMVRQNLSKEDRCSIAMNFVYN